MSQQTDSQESAENVFEFENDRSMNKINLNLNFENSRWKMTEIQNPTTKQFGNLQPNVAEYTFSTACQSNSKISSNTPNGINTDVFRKVFN